MVEAIRQGDIPGVQLRVRQSLDAPADEVWEWVSDSGRLELWMGDRAELTPGSGGGLRVESRQEPAGPLIESAETLEWSPPARWVLSFRQEEREWKASTRVTIAVHGRGEGSELDILHGGFEQLSLSTCMTVWEEYRRRWRERARRLARRIVEPAEGAG